ncbi:MAG: hypothetical protein WA777_15170 [Rhodanobacter sp.]
MVDIHASHDARVAADLAALNRIAARVIKPMPSCSTCEHFTTDHISPVAGMGVCSVGHGMHYPMARHACADHT